MSTEKIGLHTIRIEPGNTAFIKYCGSFSFDEALQVVAVMHAAFGKAPSYIINDMAEAVPPDGRTRKLMSTFLAEHNVVALVNIGAGALVRALSALIGGTTRVLYQRPHPVHFVATEAEARERITTLRAQRELPANR